MERQPGLRHGEEGGERDVDARDVVAVKAGDRQVGKLFGREDRLRETLFRAHQQGLECFARARVWRIGMLDSDLHQKV